MNPFENPESLKLLRDLLKDPDLPSSESDDDEYEAIKNKQRMKGPGNVGPKMKNRTNKLNSSQSKSGESKPLLAKEVDCGTNKKCEDSVTDIDQWLEEQEMADSLLLEDRKRPEYKVSYKQSVGTEDVFLQMGNRTAATMSCEDMVIEVYLPEEEVTIDDMKLSVTETEVDLQSPVYRLKLPLAHKINPDKGKAKYNPDKRTLTLTLRMNRELDFVNF